LPLATTHWQVGQAHLTAPGGIAEMGEDDAAHIWSTSSVNPDSWHLIAVWQALNRQS
jgi:hypothetical protein